MSNKRILPIVNVETQKGECFRAIDTAMYPCAKEIIAPRRRFREVTALLDKLDRINKTDFSRSFVNHYYIRAASLNDAYLAMIAICNKLREIEPDSAGNYILERSCGEDVIAPPAVIPAPSGGGAADSAFWNSPDEKECSGLFDEEDDEEYGFRGDDPFGKVLDLENGCNPRMLVCNSIYDHDTDIADICGKSRVVFILECDDVRSESEGFMFMQSSHSYAGTIRKTDFQCIEIGSSISGSENELAEVILRRSGFSCRCAENILERAAALLDEYAFTDMIRYAINEHLLSGSTDKTLSPAILDKAVKRFCGGDFVKKHTSGKIVGLEREQRELDSIIYGLKMRKLRAERKIGTSNGSCNILFAGSPGTAKTTLARRFAAKLADMGFINGADSFKECRKSDIVGEYVGWTAKKIDTLFSDFALSGGLIFFDEIYTISEKESSGFDKEAVTAITQNMENYRDKVYCIFAGYRDKMEEFLSANPGLRSRISYTVSFDDYDVKCLSDIFKALCADAGFALPKGSREITDSFFEKMMALRGGQFGNGREARNLLDNCERVMAYRISVMKREPSLYTLSRFTLGDIKKAAENILSTERKRCGTQVNKIGF